MCLDVALLVSDSFMVRTLKAFLLYSQFNCLGSARLALKASVETEECSEQGVQFALFLLEVSEDFVILFYSRNLLK